MRLLLIGIVAALLTASPSAQCDPHREGQPFLLSLDGFDSGLSWVNLYIDGVKQPVRTRAHLVADTLTWAYPAGLPRGLHTVRYQVWLSDNTKGDEWTETVEIAPPLFP